MRQGKLHKNFFEELTEKLGECFPKKKCKERGQALVLFAYAYQLLDKTVKAFGGCTKCFGKGYGNKTEWATSHEDFGGEATGTWKLPDISFCSCNRGMQLVDLLQKEKETLKRNIEASRKEIALVKAACHSNYEQRLTVYKAELKGKIEELDCFEKPASIYRRQVLDLLDNKLIEEI